MPKLKAYMLELRAPFLTVTILPVILGHVLAMRSGINTDWMLFIYVLLGFIFLHLGTNVFNDYFDDVNGTDKVNEEFVAPFTGGSRLIQSGVLKAFDVLKEGIILFILAILCFVPLIIKFGSVASGVLAFSLIAGIFYVAPPFKWAHRGLGEIFIFLSFGPIMLLTAYYVQSGNITPGAVIVSIVLGLLASAIVDINQFPDYKADKQTGKRNIVVRLGREKGVWFYILTVVSAYAAIITGVIMKYNNVWSLLALITLPMAMKAIVELKKNYDNPKALTPACGITIITHLVTGLILIGVQLFL